MACGDHHFEISLLCMKSTIKIFWCFDSRMMVIKNKWSYCYHCYYSCYYYSILTLIVIMALSSSSPHHTWTLDSYGAKESNDQCSDQWLKTFSRCHPSSCTKIHPVHYSLFSYHTHIPKYSTERKHAYFKHFILLWEMLVVKS